MVFNWREDHTPLFLELYKSHECLWNNKREDYKLKNIRDNAIQSICLKMNIPELSNNDIKLKIKSIRTRYMVELKKVQQSESGAGTSDIYVPKLFWFAQADGFLRHVCTSKQSSSNLNMSDKLQALCEDTDLSQSKDFYLETILAESHVCSDKNVCDEFANASLPTNLPITNFSNRRGKKRARNTKLSTVENSIDRLNKIAKGAKKEEDEFDVFCRSLAIQLRKMPLQRALICQQKLQEVMTNERINLLLDNSSNKSCSDLTLAGSTSCPLASPKDDNVTKDILSQAVSNISV